MADLTISGDEIRDALKDFVQSYKPSKATVKEVGYVIDAADGIAHVEGLPGVMANELVRFADGTLGLTLMRKGVTEEGNDAVSHALEQVALVAGDAGRAEVLIARTMSVRISGSSSAASLV